MSRVICEHTERQKHARALRRVQTPNTVNRQKKIRIHMAEVRSVYIHFSEDGEVSWHKPLARLSDSQEGGREVLGSRVCGVNVPLM